MDRFLQLFNTLLNLFNQKINNLVFKISASIVSIGYFGDYFTSNSDINVWKIIILIGFFTMIINSIWWKRIK